jgi:hypothetical protein
MTPNEEKQLLREVHENNIMLRSIVKDFGLNFVANIIDNKIT